MSTSSADAAGGQGADAHGTDDPHRTDDAAGGALPRLARRQWTLVALGLAALTAVTVWVALALASQPVRWQDVGFDVLSPTETDVTFDVFLYTDEPVTCHVHAMNVQYAEVGVGQVDIDPAAGDEQRVTLTIPTVEEANTALVRGCAPTDAGF